LSEKERSTGERDERSSIRGDKKEHLCKKQYRRREAPALWRRENGGLVWKRRGKEAHAFSNRGNQGRPSGWSTGRETSDPFARERERERGEGTSARITVRRKQPQWKVPKEREKGKGEEW
jgi:hypothetical protein